MIIVRTLRQMSVYSPDRVTTARSAMAFLSPATYELTRVESPGVREGSWLLLPDGTGAPEAAWENAARGVRFSLTTILLVLAEQDNVLSGWEEMVDHLLEYMTTGRPITDRTRVEEMRWCKSHLLRQLPQLDNPELLGQLEALMNKLKEAPSEEEGASAIQILYELLHNQEVAHGDIHRLYPI